MPEETEKAPAETTDKVEEVKDEAVEDKEVEEASEKVGTDELEERIANRVYDKIKAFVTELTTAAEDVDKLVSESVAAKQEEVEPVEETAGEVEEDVKPKRSHKLFARPGKRE